jgi:F0F1-type ATP synthase delta subunit
MSKTRLKLAQLIAEKTLKDGLSKKFSQQVAAYLIENGNTDEIGSIIRDVQSIWADKGRVEVIASSAYPLNDSAKAEIKLAVKSVYPDAKQIIINEVRDEQVLSGVKLDLANIQLDLTAESKLKQFRHLTTRKGMM